MNGVLEALCLPEDIAVELGRKIVAIAVGSIFATAAAGLLIQRSVIRQEGIAMTRDSMRVALISAENTRKSVSAMRVAGSFDDAKLLANLRTNTDFRQSNIYPTIPVVAAWNSISDVAQKEGYGFRVAARSPRDAKNTPTPDEERILGLMDKDKTREVFEVNEDTHEMVLAHPVLLSADCLHCHGDPANSPSHDGKDLLGYRMEGWHEGDQHGMFVLRAKMDRVDAVVAAGMWKTAMWLFPLAILVGIGVYFLLQKTTGHLRELTQSIAESSSQVTSAAEAISTSSQAMAQGTSEQVASLEETSAATEEITGMVRRNSDNSKQAALEMEQVNDRVKDSNTSLGEMIASMGEIKDSSHKIAKIIKVIDDISFQTNILALNAAVEAARAGESGAGFAVVADEVRNLASRSAQAAKDTAALIEDSLSKADAGSVKLQKVVVVFQGISESAEKVRVLVNSVNAGSREQTRGIEQVLSAIQQMDKVTQGSAASSEASAATSEELAAQAETMNEIAKQLRVVVEG
jgi:methyl-accepting chemotaxis protein